MADLREIFDGHWTRHLGSGGGQLREWFGKVGVVAGVTDEIEAHRDAIGTMGERFLYYRMPDDDRLSVIKASAANRGHKHEMRQELADLVTGTSTVSICPASRFGSPSQRTIGWPNLLTSRPWRAHLSNAKPASVVTSTSFLDPRAGLASTTNWASSKRAS